MVLSGDLTQRMGEYWKNCGHSQPATSAIRLKGKYIFANQHLGLNMYRSHRRNEAPPIRSKIRKIRSKMGEKVEKLDLFGVC